MTQKTLEHDIFLISPVNDILSKDEIACREHIQLRKEQGHEVYFPLDHTKQDGDPIGNIILDENDAAIKHGEFAEFYLAKTTIGSFGDLGGVVFHGKKLILVNPKKFSKSDSMEEFALSYASNSYYVAKSEIDAELFSFVDMVKDTDLPLSLEFSYDRKNLFKLGVLYASRKPFSIININELQKTPDKSYHNVLHYLHNKFNQ